MEYLPTFLTVGLTALSLAVFVFFEKRRAVAEKLVLIALLAALSSVGRWLFAALPSVQPSSFIIIIAGVALGAEYGYMVGALTALLSNLLLGLGPWSPFQMAAWGMMGGLAGLLRGPLARSKTLRVAYGGIWGYLFGWIMNIWVLISLGQLGAGLPTAAGIYAASFFFDSLHALTNALLLFLGGGPLIKNLSRIGRKYGLTI